MKNEKETKMIIETMETAVFNSDEVAEMFMNKLCKFMVVKEERGEGNDSSQIKNNKSN